MKESTSIISREKKTGMKISFCFTYIYVLWVWKTALGIYKIQNIYKNNILSSLGEMTQYISYF